MKIELTIQEFSVIVESIDRWISAEAEAGNTDHVKTLIDLSNKLDEQGIKEVMVQS